MAIFSELKIADFPGLCVASLSMKTDIRPSYISRLIMLTDMCFKYIFLKLKNASSSTQVNDTQEHLL